MQTNVSLDLSKLAERLIKSFDHEPELKRRIAQAILEIDDEQPSPLKIHAIAMSTDLKIDRRHESDAVIVADLSNDPTYARTGTRTSIKPLRELVSLLNSN